MATRPKSNPERKRRPTQDEIDNKTVDFKSPGQEILCPEIWFEDIKEPVSISSLDKKALIRSVSESVFDGKGNVNNIPPTLKGDTLPRVVFLSVSDGITPAHVVMGTGKGITKAIEKTQAYLKAKNKDLKIIVEARNLEEIAEILKTDGVYRILIDNFNYEDTKKAVALIDDKCLTESSGGINEKTAREYANCGVDYISSGALTHSVYNLDLSLKAV